MRHLILILTLTGCSQQISPVSSFCPTPIHPDPATRAWLHTLNPPPEAVRYFALIANEQASIEQACGK